MTSSELIRPGTVVQWLRPDSAPFARKVASEIVFCYPDEVIEKSIKGVERELRTCSENDRMKLMKVLKDLQQL